MHLYLYNIINMC